MSSSVKYEMEFPVQVSPSLLYKYISTPSGLSEWFADDVNSRGEIYLFMWEGSEEEAKLLTKQNEEKIRLQWSEDADAGKDTFFEMRIQVDEITKDVSLMITDFADTQGDIEDGKMLWENMVSELKQVVGSA